MGQWLFLATLGPVQEFIAAARRTRDLWFGSWWLSELSRVAAATVRENGGKLIFPGTDPAQAGQSSFANKILAVLDRDPAELGERVQQAVAERQAQLWVDAQARIKGRLADEPALAQIQDLPEVYWAAVPLPDHSAYAEARRAVEALMAARKATRDFAPVTWGDAVPKSSIDGQRESVIPEDAYPQGLGDPQRRSKIDALYEQYRAGPAERLSGVDLLKRHARPESMQPSFSSTADVAVRTLLRRLETLDRSVAQQAWQTYLHALKTLAGTARLAEERARREAHWLLEHYDGGLLLESRVGELFDDDAQARQQALAALADFYRAVRCDRPQPYYAILVADGDRMGATIDNQSSMEAHQDLSQRQSHFAQAARAIVQNHDGSLVYAGGDDVLALLPLHTVLQCARELHRRFEEIINPPGQPPRFTDGHGAPPTLSVGIAIVHYIEPLGDALALARAAERVAKRVPDKNALAITLSKRSGADITVQGRWGELDTRLEQFVILHRLDALPDGAAFQLRDLAERLTPKQGQPTLPSQAALAEAKRIIGRKQPRRGQDEKLADATRQAIYSALAAGHGHALATIRVVADELIVARLLASAADLAGLPLQGA
ncbi:type III-B CRISPR-associated protein Cas10/Cmr2 [Kallotenue papyrolyticum]|uniref:type III-B CRISPR-associated protein Cas10/Cmr2 n=1 Tax=Kallotenue papyrolyticum TaxID=1325125 RepID=UPI0004923D3C|nr:type III-B CRISPR-associated protein Cas10/Cmr2 [Kallotenue papyrolyticum]